LVQGSLSSRTNAQTAQATGPEKMNEPSRRLGTTEATGPLVTGDAKNITRDCSRASDPCSRGGWSPRLEKKMSPLLNRRQHASRWPHCEGNQGKMLPGDRQAVHNRTATFALCSVSETLRFFTSQRPPPSKMEISQGATCGGGSGEFVTPCMVLRC